MQPYCALSDDHSLLTSFNGGLWKTVTGLGPKEEYQVCFVGFLGCYVFELYYVLMHCFNFSKSFNDFSFQKVNLLKQKQH